MCEAFHWREGLSRSLRQAPGFYGVIVAGMTIGAALSLMGVKPIRALYLAAVFNGLAAPPIIVLMLLASRNPRLGRWRSRALSIILVGAAAALMFALPAWYVIR
jgi:Mn2+/Fe2+ NRAMP family transporter